MSKNISSILISIILSSLVIKGISVRIGMTVSAQNEYRFRRYIQRGYMMAKNASINDTVTDELEVLHEVVDICDGISGSRTALNLVLNNSVQALFGSLCSRNCIAMAQIASYWNIPYFPLDCFDSRMDNSSIYNSVVRIFGSLTGFSYAFQTFFKRNNWNITAIITESKSDFCSFGLDAIRSNFRKNSILVVEYFELLYELYEEEIKVWLNKIKESARVIIICHENYDFLRKMIYMAQDQGMTDPTSYVWITFYNIYGEFALNMLFYPWEKEISDRKDFQTRKMAFEAVKIISYANFTSLSEQRIDTNRRNRNRSSWMIFLSDSINLFIKSRSRAFSLGLNYNLGSVLANQSKFIEFKGYTDTVKFDDDADRQMAFTVWSLKPRSQTFTEFLRINHTENNYSAFLVGAEWWGDSKKPPPAIPICGFDNRLCATTSNSSGILGGISVLVVVAFVVVSTTILIRMKLNEKKIQSMAWKIKYGDLQFLRKSKSVRSQLDLDEHNSCKITVQSFRELDERGSGEIIAHYKNDVVMVYYSSKHDVNLSRKDLIELVKMRELHHDNLNKFIGACTETDRICFLMQFCSRGSLQDVLADSQLSIDWSFKISFITDIAKGMAYLHRSFVVQHGHLTSNVCMVDNRWVIKVSCFGLQAFHEDLRLEKQDISFYRNLLWTAPEYLKSSGCSQKGDVYGFSIIAYEILYRAFPYQDYNLEYKQIIENILRSKSEPFRPYLAELLDTDANIDILLLVKQCWAEEPSARPSFETIEKSVKRFSEKTGNIVDSMLKKVEKYANNLENIVEQRTEELTEEKRKTDILLHSMLPPFIADELKAGRRVEPRMYDMATVYFSDIVGFTILSSQSTPLQIVNLLNDLYGAFDDTIAKHNVYKVETIGDAYMVVSGLPQVTNRHVVEICNMALDLLSIVQTFKIRHRPEMMLMLRIGIHSGPCAAGVVGHTMPRYCLFGDTVNTASRMESTGEALKIHLSATAREELLKFPGYVIELRGPTELKGKGTMTTYWLIRREVVFEMES